MSWDQIIKLIKQEIKCTYVPSTYALKSRKRGEKGASARAPITCAAGNHSGESNWVFPTAANAMNETQWHQEKKKLFLLKM